MCVFEFARGREKRHYNHQFQFFIVRIFMPWGFSRESKASSDLSHDGSHAYCIQTLKRNTLMLPEALREADPSERVKQTQSFQAFPSQLSPTSTHFPTKSSNGDHLSQSCLHPLWILSLLPCFVPHPCTAAVVYQAEEQGYSLRMGFPRSHSGQVRDWSPVPSDSDSHAIKSRSEHFNWKGLCRGKKS